MKKALLTVLFLFWLLICKAQDVHTIFIGKSREYIRTEERNQKINLIDSGISDKGFQYEMYSPFTKEESLMASTAFYYDMNYNCVRVRLFLSRGIAPDFIEKSLNVKFHRIDNTTWASFDAKYVVALQINSGDDYVTFDFMTREAFLKY